LILNDQGAIPSDKLSYKDLLKEHVNKCLNSVGDYDQFLFNVNALRSAMYFNVEGIPFKDKIDVVEKKLNRWLQIKDLELQAKLGRMYFHPFYRLPKIEQYRYQANYNLFQNLLEILSKHNMLVESRGFSENWDENESDKEKKKKER